MSRFRTLSLVCLVGVVLVTAAGCSSDNKNTTATSKPAPVFGNLDPGVRVGVCGAYTIPNMKKILGGGKYFRVLAPTAIGEKGDPVTGETCSWQRTNAKGGDLVTLQVEARNYGKDTAGLISQMSQLQTATNGATPVANLGEAAFSSVSATSTLLDVRKGGYFLTFSSRAEGKEPPVPLTTLQFLAGAALDKVK